MDKRYGILVICVTILALSMVGTASATNWTVDGSGGADFARIQDAINDAKDGDTIMVHSGVYHENVVVDKTVTLKGIEHPVVDARKSGSAIRLTADGITLEGFTVANSGSFWWGAGIAGIKGTSNNNTITGNNVRSNGVGIYLSSSRNNSITGNNVSNNNREDIRFGNGIRFWSGSSPWGGIYLSSSSSNNTITGNNICNNDKGIRIDDFCNNNTITGNNICNNGGLGIYLSSSRNNTITGNVFVNDGLSVYSSYQNTVEDNIVNSKPLVYLEDVSDYKVEDAGQVILVNCDNITVENLDLSNTSCGISLWKTENSKISNNTVCNNNWGGIGLSSSTNNSITGNNVSNNNWVGIRLSSSSKNSITGNNVSNNNDKGIRLYYSSKNSITGNNVSNNNRGGIDLSFSSNNNTITGNNICNNGGLGIYLSSSRNNTITGNVFVNDGLPALSPYQNIVEDNTVNGKPLVYLEDVSDHKVEDAGQVILVNCDNITVENLDLSNTDVGIVLRKTENSKISNNTVCNNNRGGIRLYYSSNNTITGNNVSKNNYKGIIIHDSSNNIIYFNSFINNTDNVDSHKSTTIWNSPLEMTYTYDGTTYKSCLGNYWDDYEGTDAEGDGIGDTSYSLKGDKDNYPLMKPFENYIT